MIGSLLGPLRRFPPIHLLRVGMFVLVIALIHGQHRKFLARTQSQSLHAIPLERTQQFFPAAAQYGDASAEGGLTVLSAEKELLGQILQTSPTSDRFVGFSGPTNVLIALAPDGKVLGAEILSSRDTREHVGLISRDAAFWNQFRGRSPTAVSQGPHLDGVTGATLTTIAILQGWEARFGGAVQTSKFPDPPRLADVQKLFPEVTEVSRLDASAMWSVQKGPQTIGTLLRSSPAADEIVGYQGPTETLIGVDSAGRITGVALGVTYDNEEYVAYIRGDDYFREIWNGRTLADVAQSDPLEEGFEGVSGATTTSLAVARTLIEAARVTQAAPAQSETAKATVPWNTVGSLTVIGWGLLVGLTSLRRRWWARRLLQLAIVGYLGFTNGELLSQAMLVGWAQSGVPWSSATGLVVLTVAAFLVPLLTRRNVYCSHLCPHGAIQEWLRPSGRRTWHVPRGVARWLGLIRPLLLLWILAVALLHWPYSLVDIEPFDAYVWRAAGWATVAIAIAGLVASAFVPMAYCRYGCPTGAVLDYVRTHGTATQWTRRDTLALTLSLAGAALWLWS
ncbi:FMN-binding protein [Planctomyces sp. SH-PL14]|uniref:FMN-binding protein n=1 Tax=Planctomyces sp. SH-PL14 TaxID=1632864 RepID=UPI00078E335C|nr:FMN-binding protein [Planctomyces sp. SH-PL14]AMV18584.1 Putative electron transport protein YccM [Planctomyces sp. SH-PL14]